jgi:ketosteroid isomerase-like protein
MSAEGEAIVRRSWDAINRSSSADEVMAEIGEFLHPDCEWVNPADALERGTRRGHDGVRLAFENYFAGAGPDAAFEIEELIERGDKVFVRGRLHGLGVSRGAEVLGPGIGAIITLRDSLIYRMEWYWDKDEALAKFEGAKPALTEAQRAVRR